MRNGDFPALTPDELSSTGAALFGSAWRAELARAFGVDETDIVQVESGRVAAPEPWRAMLIAIAQDTALRALDVANNLMWRERPEAEAEQALHLA